MAGRKVAQFLMVFENNFCFLGLSLNDVNMRAVDAVVFPSNVPLVKLELAVILAVNLEKVNVAVFVLSIIDGTPL